MKVHFMSQDFSWQTPRAVYDELDKEFHFNFDPCPVGFHKKPIFGDNGLTIEWGTSTFCNPPYGRTIGDWIAKGYAESLNGKTVVLLIPSRTDTKWWHEYCMKAKEIRYIRGRLKFGRAKYNAPFPSAIVIFQGSTK
jgi:phage N-6-adenine-methyltransferase